METKVQKTIFTHTIEHYHFFRNYSWNAGRNLTRGVVFLSDNKKIVVKGSQFILVNADEVTEGIVLKSNPAYRRIKRMIARYFQDYRIGPKSFFRERITTLRGAAINGQHNCNLFRISNISFKEHKSDFLKLAS